MDLRYPGCAVTGPAVHFWPQPTKPFVPLFCYTVPYGADRPWRAHCDSLETGSDVALRRHHYDVGVDTCGSDLSVSMLVLANNGSRRDLHGPLWIHLY